MEKAHGVIPSQPKKPISPRTTQSEKHSQPPIIVQMIPLTRTNKRRTRCSLCKGYYDVTKEVHVCGPMRGLPIGVQRLTVSELIDRVKVKKRDTAQPKTTIRIGGVDQERRR